MLQIEQQEEEEEEECVTFSCEMLGWQTNLFHE
jgi:hypothetical protein